MQLISITFYTIYVIFGILIGILTIYLKTKEPEDNLIQSNQMKRQKGLVQDMTKQQLKIYNHQSNQETLLALKGIIYDVSSSQFYKTGGPYAIFTGHDASINFAKMSTDADFLNKYEKITLTYDQKTILDDWVTRFQKKYPIVGKIIE